MTALISKLLGHEKATADYIPFSTHITPEFVMTKDGDLVCTIRLSGVAHEARDDLDLHAWHLSLNGAIKTIADDDIAIWRHTVRQKRGEYPNSTFESGSFAAMLDQRYKERLSGVTMYANDLYISVVQRGFNSVLASKARAKKDLHAQISARCERLQQTCEALLASLANYSPELLGSYEIDGREFSAPLTFYGFLINHEWQHVPLNLNARICDVLGSSQLLFGTDALIINKTTDTEFAGMLSITNYPEFTETGHMNILLSLPCECVVTHSYACISKIDALKSVKKQQDKMSGARDASVSQVEALTDLRDDIMAGRVVLGEHHFSLLIKTDQQKDLNRLLGLAKGNLAELEFTSVRENLALEAAYFAQLPGVFDLRPRPAAITSKNFAALIAMHNYPQGQAKGNQWGDALALINTVSGSPYYFNLHQAHKAKRGHAQSDDDRVPGNTLILGNTGSGKTVVQTFIMSMAQKYNPRIFVWDKDQGMKIWVERSGGTYLNIKMGQPTGISICKLKPTPQNISFIQSVLLHLCNAERTPIRAIEQNELFDCITAMMTRIDEQHRSIQSLLQTLTITDTDGPHARLLPWANGGDLGWALDCDHDVFDLRNTRLFGVDCTEFLDHPMVKTPLCAYLFHRMHDMIDGSPFMNVMDEFWKIVNDPLMAPMVENANLVIRKLNGLNVFATQNPHQVIHSKIGYAIIENCVTHLYMPNPRASRDDYIKGLRLSEKEFDLIQRVMPEMNLRGFLFKQNSRDAMGGSATVCELDLSGMDDELAIMSGTKNTVAYWDRAGTLADGNLDKQAKLFHQIRKGEL
jgi:type IV secretion system protein VirB4